MGPPDSHEVPRVSRYLGAGHALFGFIYEAVTRYGVPFQTSSTAYSKSFMPVLQPRSVETERFGLFPFRSPLLRESRLISFPPGTEMFHFPGLASSNLCIQFVMLEHNFQRVSPFRNHRIKGCLAPPRCLSQLTASFIASQRQGIRLSPLISCLLRTSFSSMQLSMNCGNAVPPPVFHRFAIAASAAPALNEKPYEDFDGGPGKT